ncbi:MAG: hypothetical protein A2734_02905 [Parcubacteria group bacterium RIFCSPHIGHO2_01_FULL_40_30]|nr:MAG: hypothetical protein A2734_02905 [Parcubacteria group bacterium RIFCSPHIGHO2_01_FULL_40_30]OHB23597.1 MAG: hypothetical protein A3I22_03045 [Parcubacteria group bacterium RIFCSPLOWO2_02_FULL_40_12]
MDAKKLILPLIILGFAVVLLFYSRINQPESFEFRGSIINVDADVITTEGSFIFNDENSSAVVKSEPKKVKIIVNGNTKLTRVNANLPFTFEEIKNFLKKDGKVPGATLDREEKNVSVEELKSDLERYGKIDITVTSGKNIYGKNSFNAGTITYFLPLGIRE